MVQEVEVCRVQVVVCRVQVVEVCRAEANMSFLWMRNHQRQGRRLVPPRGTAGAGGPAAGGPRGGQRRAPDSPRPPEGPQSPRGGQRRAPDSPRPPEGLS